MHPGEFKLNIEPMLIDRTHNATFAMRRKLSKRCKVGKEVTKKLVFRCSENNEYFTSSIFACYRSF